MDLDSSRTLVAPGVRLLERPAWRAGVGSALATVASRPYLWLVGMAAFGLRGGILLLVLPILVIPTQVEVRLMIGSYLGSTGFTPGFWLLLAAFSFIAAIVAAAALYALARLDVATFAALRRPETTPRDRRNDALQVFAVHMATLSCLVVAAIPVGLAAISSAYDEVARPSATGDFYDRVLATLGPTFFAFLVVLVVIEVVASLAARRILEGSSMRSALTGSIAGILRSPARTFGTAMVSWAATLGVLLVSGWAIGMAWQTVRASFLSPAAFGDPQQDPVMVLAAVALAATMIIGLLLAGIASALRAAFWSVEQPT